MEDEEHIDPSAEAIGMVLAAIASSLVSTTDDAGVERFRSAYGGFFEAANVSESQNSEVLQIANSLTELFDYTLNHFLDNPSIERLR